MKLKSYINSIFIPMTFLFVTTSAFKANAYIIAYMGGKTEITAQSYDRAVGNMTASYPSKIFDEDVSLMAVGSNIGEGNMMIVAAAGFAAKIRDLHPGRLVVLYANNEGDDRQKNEETLKSVGFKIIKNTRESMKLQNVFSDHLWRFTKIASLEFFTHSNMINGMLFENQLSRYDGVDPTSMSDAQFDEEVKNHNFSFLRVNPEQKKLGIERKFLPNAFAGVYGCNTGWKIAPTMARAWRIPVAGSYTGTEFQYPGSDGNYYYGGKVATGVTLLKKNTLAFKKPLACYGDRCTQLKPTNFGYRGKWAQGTHNGVVYREYDAGLGYYKFSCATSDKITKWNQQSSVNRAERGYDSSMDHCKRGMAEWVTRMPSVKTLDASSTFEDYKRVVQDIMCPTSVFNDRAQEKCLSVIDKALVLSATDASAQTYTPYTINSITCDWKSCSYQADCDSVDVPLIGTVPSGFCRVKRSDSKVLSTVFMDDYKTLLESYFVAKNLPFNIHTVKDKVSASVAIEPGFKLPKQVSKPNTGEPR